MLARAAEAGVKTILMPAIDRSTHGLMLDTEKDNPGLCLSMIGLHPCSVREDFEDELDAIEQYLDQRAFHGIGETGLDFYWDLSFTGQQYIAFKKQADWAIAFKKPLVIHSRNSTDESIEVVREKQNGGLTGVFHCFSGTVEQARQVIDLGFYLGIGGVLTFKNSGLDKVVKELGTDRLVLETDAPYLAPTPYRGKQNEPAYLPLIAQKLADIFEQPIETIAEKTTANAKELFGL